MRGVRVERDGDIVVARIDRPERLNAADLDVYAGLEAALDQDAGGVVLTGDARAFSAGDDIAIFDFAGLGPATEFIVEVTRIFRAIEASPVPVVAAVSGYALGFGFELALACDAVVATPDAVLGLPEITHGAAPPNAMGRGVDVLGLSWVRHLAVTGSRWLSGTEALDLGLVVECHDQDSLLPAAISLCRVLASGPAFTEGKQLLNRGGDDAYRAAASFMPPLMASPEVAVAQSRYTEGP